MVARIKKLKTWFLAVLTSFWTWMRLKKLRLILVILVCIVVFLVVALDSCRKDGATVNSCVVGYTEYRGHNYLVFAAKDVYDGSFSVVHDPDCICYKVD